MILYLKNFIKLLFGLLILVVQSNFVMASSADEGKKLFRNNCLSCHSVTQKIVGPPLHNVHTRHNEEWLFKFIKNSQALVRSGDEQAVKLFNASNKIVMNPFEYLNDDQIKSILAYIKEESEKTPEPIINSGLQADSDGDPKNIAVLSITVNFLVVAIGALLIYITRTSMSIWSKTAKVKAIKLAKKEKGRE